MVPDPATLAFQPGMPRHLATVALAAQEVGKVIGESDACVGLPYLYLTLTLGAVHACVGGNAGGILPALRSVTS